MNYRTITGTDLSVAAICIGSTGIGSTIDREMSFQLLDLYVDSGGNFIDTAAVYANWLPGEMNVSEKTIGRWSMSRGNREQIILATKGAHPELATMHVPRMLRGEIEADLNDSLRNLQTDIIDLYWLHRDDPSQPVEVILETMNDQIKAGKIRYFGCSNWRAPRIRAAQTAADAMGIDGFVADQMMWSLASFDPDAIRDRTTVAMDEGLFDYHEETGLPAIAYSSQAGGLFQKMAAGKSPASDLYPTQPNRERLARIQHMADETGLTLSQIVLGYLQSQPFVTVPIVGCRTLTQLRDSLAAADVQLTSRQINFLTCGA